MRTLIPKAISKTYGIDVLYRPQMTKYRPADFADEETSSMGSIQIGENSNNSPGLHVRFENPGSNHNNLHNQIHYSGNLAYLQQMVGTEIPNKF